MRFRANTGTASRPSTPSICRGSVWEPVHHTSIVYSNGTPNSSPPDAARTRSRSWARHGPGSSPLASALGAAVAVVIGGAIRPAGRR